MKQYQNQIIVGIASLALIIAGVPVIGIALIVLARVIEHQHITRRALVTGAVDVTVGYLAISFVASIATPLAASLIAWVVVMRGWYVNASARRRAEMDAALDELGLHPLSDIVPPRHSVTVPVREEARRNRTARPESRR